MRCLSASVFESTVIPLRQRTATKTAAKIALRRGLVGKFLLSGIPGFGLDHHPTAGRAPTARARTAQRVHLHIVGLTRSQVFKCRAATGSL
jgi:hypothetical protein